jgi:hypothetical protein
MALSYSETLTLLRDNLLNIQTVLNNNGYDGSQPISMWPSMIIEGFNNNNSSDTSGTYVETFINGDGDFCIDFSNADYDWLTGEVNIFVIFNSVLDDVEYNQLEVLEFGSAVTTYVKADVQVFTQVVQFTDEDASSHDYYAIRFTDSDYNHISQSIWDSGIYPVAITFRVDDTDHSFSIYIDNSEVDNDSDFLGFVNGNGDIVIKASSFSADWLGDSLTVTVEFNKDISSLTYSTLNVVEFGEAVTTYEKADKTISDNKISFTDEDTSSHDFYCFSFLDEDDTRIGSDLWEDGLRPQTITFSTSDNSYTFDIYITED